MEFTSPQPPPSPPPRAPAPRATPWHGWYLLGGVLLIGLAAVVLFAGARMRWGTAKGITLAAVGLGQLATWQALRTAAQAPEPTDGRFQLTPLGWTRLATAVAWLAWIVVWVAERLTR
jgi:hypothetical protein